MPKHKWSFNGITGTFDRAALQRGFKVYREVCAGMSFYEIALL